MDERSTWSVPVQQTPTYFQLYRVNNLVNSRSTLKWHVQQPGGKMVLNNGRTNHMVCIDHHATTVTLTWSRGLCSSQTKDGIRIEPASNSKISIRSPSSNAIRHPWWYDPRIKERWIDPDGVCTGYSKAFDTVEFKTVRMKMQNLGFSREFLLWMISNLSNRKRFLQIDDKQSNLATVEFGVPHGSIQGPVIFNLYVADLQDKLQCPWWHNFLHPL